MSVPAELSYNTPSYPTPVVLKRSVFRMRNSATDVGISTNGSLNNRIEYRINTRTFIDLKTMMFRVKITAGGPVANDGLFSMYNIFDEITLRNESGTIIERLDDAATIAQILLNLYASKDHLNTVGSFSNASYGQMGNPAEATAATDTYYSLPLFRLLGFFRTGKIIRPSTFGGLYLQLRLGTQAQVVSRNVVGGGTAAPADVNYTFSEMDLFFDECLVDQSYEEYYNTNYDTRGFRLDINTFDHVNVSLNTGGNTSERVVRLPFSVTNCLALISVMRRQDAKTSSANNYRAFIPPTANFHYQYVNEGQRYPQVRVENYERAYEEVLKLTRTNRGFVSQNLINKSNFSTLKAYEGSVPTGEVSTFMYIAHLEKMLGSNYTGVSLDSNSCALEVQSNVAAYAPNSAGVGEGVENLMIDAFAYYISSVYVMNGQVTVSK